MSPVPSEPLPRLRPQGEGGIAYARSSDARWRVLGTLAFVILVVLIPPGRPLPFPAGAYPLDLTWTLLAAAWTGLLVGRGISRRPFRPWLLRIAGMAPLVALLVSPVVFSRGWAIGGETAGVMLARSLTAFAAVTLLTDTTPFPHILSALSRLRVPALLIAVPAFMYRYLGVLSAELEKMRRARAARSFRRSRWADWKAYAGLIAVLFVRSFERAERVHSAMCARGFDGTMRRLE